LLAVAGASAASGELLHIHSQSGQARRSRLTRCERCHTSGRERTIDRRLYQHASAIALCVRARACVRACMQFCIPRERVCMWIQVFVCLRCACVVNVGACTGRTHRGAVSVRFHALVGLSGQPKTDGHSTR
jgi:hypothetical protein